MFDINDIAEYPQLAAAMDLDTLGKVVSRTDNPLKVAAALKSKGKAATDSLIETKPALAAVLSKIDQLPQELAEGLANKSMRVMDFTAFSAKAATGATQVSMFATDDTKIKGLRNVANAKLDQWTIVYGIQILSGVNATLGATAFAAPAADVLNGEYMFSCGTSVFFDYQPTSNFGNATSSPLRPGYFPLANPVVLKKDDTLKFELNFAAALALNTNLKLALYCGQIVKAV